MSALRQPDFSVEYYSPQTPLVKSTPQQQQPTSKPSAKSPTIIKPQAFSAPATLPKKLKTLSLLQKSSFGLAIASMTASIGLYVATVQIPKLWSQEYRHLENLQRQERQLISINETIKYQIAQEAGQDNRLAISQPESAVFISPAKVEAKSLANIADNQSSVNSINFPSLGY